MKTGCSAPILGVVLNKLRGSGGAGYYYEYSYHYYGDGHQRWYCHLQRLHAGPLAAILPTGVWLSRGGFPDSRSGRSQPAGTAVPREAGRGGSGARMPALGGGQEVLSQMAQNHAVVPDAFARTPISTNTSAAESWRRPPRAPQSQSTSYHKWCKEGINQ